MLLFVVLSCFVLKAQSQPVTFDKIAGLQKLEKRPVFILIQTNWCKYCGSMKHSMFKNREISALLDKKFYVVLLDAEEKNTINFAGRSFRYQPTGKNVGIHQLAKELGTIHGQISYPSVCFLNEKNEIIFQHAGYLNPEALKKILMSVSGQST
jgi:thioredoxin-related protein